MRRDGNMVDKKPKTPIDSAYRCHLACRIGIDALDGKIETPEGVTPLEFAVYNLLHAVAELSEQIEESQQKRKPPIVRENS